MKDEQNKSADAQNAKDEKKNEMKRRTNRERDQQLCSV